MKTTPPTITTTAPTMKTKITLTSIKKHRGSSNNDKLTTATIKDTTSKTNNNKITLKITAADTTTTTQRVGQVLSVN